MGRDGQGSNWLCAGQSSSFNGKLPSTVAAGTVLVNGKIDQGQLNTDIIHTDRIYKLEMEGGHTE